MELLESLGLLDSSGGTGFNVENMAENGAETPDELSARLAEIKSLLSSESSTELEGLRQLIAEALQAAKSSQTIGNSADGPLPEQAAKIAELAQLLKGMSSDHGNRNRNEAGHEAKSSSGDKSAETVSAMNRIAAELANSAGVADPSKSAESSEAASLKDNAADRATSVDGQGTDAGENAKEASASELLPEDSRTQEEAETPDKTGSSGRNGHQSTNSAALGRGAHPGDEPVQLNRHADESAQVSKAIDDAHGAKNSAREERHGNGTEQETPPNQGSSEVPKIIKDAQAIKDNPMKTGAAFSDDFGAKLNNSDGSTNYNGLFNSESQNTEKAFANISGSKEPEAGQFALKTQTLDQIVQKAVIHLKNGQHEARIDLKPDYLGHVRMQVITENHQVTVKILTEFSFVKDLIENNAHQLKADMQQQGLNVDKLEVSVSNGRDDRADSQGRGERLNRRRQFSGHGDAGHLEEDVRMQTGPTRRPAANASAVDYFA
jgi:flagellar hook-length control protein FliK